MPSVANLPLALTHIIACFSYLQRQKGIADMKRKRKRGDKREAPLPQWTQPTGMIGSKPPLEQRNYKGWGWGKLYERQWHLPNPSIKRAMQWTALFVLFIVIIYILELALR